MALSLNAPADGYARDFLQPGVVFKDRLAVAKATGGICDFVFFVLFIIGLVAQVIIGILFYASPNIEFDSNGVATPLTQDLLDDLAACTPSGRRVLAGGDGLFQRMTRFPEIPAVMILIMPFIAAIWLLVLKFFPRLSVWGTIIISGGMYIAIGVIFIIEGVEATVGGLFIAVGAITLIFFFLYKSKVEKTATRVQLAAQILFSKPQIFLAAFVLEVIMLGIIAFTAGAFIFSAQLVQVDPVTCELVPTEQANSGRYFMAVYLLWAINFCDMAKLLITAMSVGSYFFGQWESGNPIAALKVALTTSVGTISASALVTALVEWIVYEATSTFWWLNPVDCVLYCILACFRSVIMAYTRFLVVAHSFSGDGFGKSGMNMFKIMTRNFTGAYVNDRIGVMVVHLGSTIFALCIAFASWQWVESAAGVSLLTEVIPEIAASGGFALLGFFFFFIVLLRNPVPTLMVIILFERSIYVPLETFDPTLASLVVGPFVALFLGSIAGIVFRFQGDVVLHAIDTLFLCSAIGPMSGSDLPAEAKEFYTLLASDDNFVLTAEAVKV